MKRGHGSIPERKDRDEDESFVRRKMMDGR